MRCRRRALPVLGPLAPLLLLSFPLVRALAAAAPPEAEARRSPRAAGRPSIHPEDPRRFVMDGRPWVPLGYTPGLGALTLRRDGVGLEEYFPAFHDWLRARGLNYYRTVFSFGQAFAGAKNDETLPYLRTGPGEAADGGPRFDLDRFEPRHFEYWRRVIEDAGRKGIVVQLALFDSWHLNRVDHGNGWGRRFDVYHGANNVNEVSFDLEEEASWHRAAASSAVYRRQQELVDEVVERLGDLPNLIWEVCNEPDAYHDSWAVPLARHLQGRDRGRHLVIPLDLPDHQHTPGMEAPEHLAAPAHDALVARSGGTAPLIVHNDAPKSFLPAAMQRHKAWAVLTGGAHLNYFFNDEDLHQIRRSHTRASRGAAFVGRVGDFLAALDVDLAGMRPCDDRVSGPVDGGSWCLGRPGEELVVYKRELPGNGWLAVKGLPAAYRARWFDPRRGVLHPAPVRGTDTPAGRSFTPPQEPGEDWVLHVRSGGEPDRASRVSARSGS